MLKVTIKPDTLTAALGGHTPRLIAFDFDHTLSTVMLGRESCHFQKHIEAVSEAEFGGRERVQMLRQMFTLLCEHGVQFFIISNGFRHRIDVALRNVGLGEFFPESNLICQDSMEFRLHGYVKGEVIRARMELHSVPANAALFIDDCRRNLDGAAGVCMVFHPQSAAEGLSRDEIQSIMDRYRTRSKVMEAVQLKPSPPSWMLSQPPRMSPRLSPKMLSTTSLRPFLRSAASWAGA